MHASSMWNATKTLQILMITYEKQMETKKANQKKIKASN